MMPAQSPFSPSMASTFLEQQPQTSFRRHCSGCWIAKELFGRVYPCHHELCRDCHWLSVRSPLHVSAKLKRAVNASAHETVRRSRFFCPVCGEGIKNFGPLNAPSPTPSSSPDSLSSQFLVEYDVNQGRGGRDDFDVSSEPVFPTESSQSAAPLGQPVGAVSDEMSADHEGSPAQSFRIPVSSTRDFHSQVLPAVPFSRGFTPCTQWHAPSPQMPAYPVFSWSRSYTDEMGPAVRGHDSRSSPRARRRYFLRLDGVPEQASKRQIEDWVPQQSLTGSGVLAIHFALLLGGSGNASPGTWTVFVEAASVEMQQALVSHKQVAKPLEGSPLCVSLVQAQDILAGLFPWSHLKLSWAGPKSSERRPQVQELPIEVVYLVSSPKSP